MSSLTGQSGLKNLPNDTSNSLKPVENDIETTVTSNELQVSPKRPKGPNKPIVAAEPEHAAQWVASTPQRSSNSAAEQREPSSAIRSLFGLFRKPSMASLRGEANRTKRPESLRAATPSRRASTSVYGAQGPSTFTAPSMADSLYGGLDSLMPGAQQANLLSPQRAIELSKEVGHVVQAASKFRKAIDDLSSAAAEFGNALDQCSKIKGFDVVHVDTDLQVAGGLHMLISNHVHLLAAAIGEKFQDPVQVAAREYANKVSKREAEFKIALRNRIQALRSAEVENHRQSRRRNRNLIEYRSSLLDLTSQIDDINRLKFEFLSDLRVLATDLAEQIHISLASVVTAEVEVFESISHKGWSGGGLEQLMSICADPFESSGPPARLRTGTDEPETAKDRGLSRETDLRAAEFSTSPSGSPPGASDNEVYSGSPPQMFSVLPPRSILPKRHSIENANKADLTGDLTIASHPSVSSFDEAIGSADTAKDTDGDVLPETPNTDNPEENLTEVKNSDSSPQISSHSGGSGIS